MKRTCRESGCSDFRILTKSPWQKNGTGFEWFVLNHSTSSSNMDCHLWQSTVKKKKFLKIQSNTIIGLIFLHQIKISTSGQNQKSTLACSNWKSRHPIQSNREASSPGSKHLESAPHCCTNLQAPVNFEILFKLIYKNFRNISEGSLKLS